MVKQTHISLITHLINAKSINNLENNGGKVTFLKLCGYVQVAHTQCAIAHAPELCAALDTHQVFNMRTPRHKLLYPGQT